MREKVVPEKVELMLQGNWSGEILSSKSFSREEQNVSEEVKAKCILFLENIKCSETSMLVVTGGNWALTTNCLTQILTSLLPPAGSSHNFWQLRWELHSAQTRLWRYHLLSLARRYKGGVILRAFIKFDIAITKNAARFRTRLTKD